MLILLNKTWWGEIYTC